MPRWVTCGVLIAKVECERGPLIVTICATIPRRRQILAWWRQHQGGFTAPTIHGVMLCIYNGDAVFDWDENNLRKIRAHRIKRDDVEFALSNGPIPIYERRQE